MLGEIYLEVKVHKLSHLILHNVLDFVNLTNLNFYRIQITNLTLYSLSTQYFDDLEFKHLNLAKLLYFCLFFHHDLMFESSKDPLSQFYHLYWLIQQVLISHLFGY